LTRLEARKNMLFEMMEHGVKEVLKLKEKINGIYGTVSSLASVKDEFSLPLRIACGNKLNYVVVENEDVAEKCIEHLRKNKIGIATFLPLNRLKKLKKLEIEKVDGFIDLAINLLNYDKKFENVFSYVLGNTIVIKDFETAKRIGIGRYRMVTMDGDLIEKSGAISGGYRQKELIGFNPEKIESEINRLSNLTEKLRNEIKDLRVNLDERQRKLNETKDKEKEILFILNEIQKKKDEIERKIGKIEIKEIKKIEEELNFYEEKRKELFKKINFFPISSEEVLNIQNEIKELKKNFDELKIERSSIEASIKNILLPEIENFEKIKNNLEKEESNFNLEIEKINTQMLKVEEELKEKVENEKKFYEKLKDFFKKRENIAKRNEILQRRKMILTERKNKLNESINALKNERARISGILEGLYKRYEEYRILDIKEVRESFEEINKRIEDIKQKISLIGAPNMRALQIYKEVEKEYNEIKSKVEKLNEERNSIMKIIDEIETKKKVAFLETLTKIEENFQKIHSILCPGWEVKLIIQDPQNLFESGIEVRVKEPGKTFTTIRVLSGGQKTMVALSFIFALQEYRPAPFYIFDEVDEALDKENSDRLAQLIRKYAEKSQFIVISHNDIMIEKSDYLYGVTMKQDGESQIVSMRL
jgi:chromosome segregation protein